jgi:hypothetical protein
MVLRHTGMCLVAPDAMLAKPTLPNVHHPDNGNAIYVLALPDNN